MKKWDIALQIIAVLCSYLILSITFASAVEIRIFTSSGQEFSADLQDFSDFIKKEISYPYEQNYQFIKIRLSAQNPSYLIKKVYLYRCKGFAPADCISKGIEPVISVNTGSSALVFDETYKWDDVNSDNIGNFIAFVKLDVNGREVWTGSMDRVTKTGIRTFSLENYDADRLDLYLKSGISADNVKSYIESYHAIPSDQANRSVFQAVSGSAVAKMHALSGSKDKIDPSGTGIPVFYASSLSGNVFNKSVSTWDFVFAADGKTANPVVFYSTSAGPPITGGAALAVDDFSPQVTTCWGSDLVTVSMHVENASSIGYFQSYYYTIDGAKGGDGSITCSIINPNASIYSYQCSIPVASFPACTAPGTSGIKLYFNYAGGIQLSTDSIPLTLKAPVPTLYVSSATPLPFDCGIDTELTAKLQVLNPMQGGKVYHSFDGKNFNASACTGSAGSHLCAIPESQICQLLQENLELTFKIAYGETEILALPVTILVTFPPPSMGIDTVTPQAVEAGKTTSVNVLLHVNYPDFLTYDENSFNYKYLVKAFQPAGCSLESSYSNIKYYKCSVALEIPSGKQGIETLSFRLDGYMGGQTKQLTANGFYEILPPPPLPSLTIASTSSPLKCIQDPSLTVTAKSDNIEGTPQPYYSVDAGKTYKNLTCSSSGSSYTCAIQKDDLCGLMSTSLTLLLKFVFPSKELISNPQDIYITLPEPHIQVYAISPDTLPVGEKTSAVVSLFVQYPKMVGDTPAFLYSYLNKTNQKMTCSKVSATSNRDFYECASTQFDIPGDYTKTSLPVLFSIQGTTLSFPMSIPVSTAVAAGKPWLEIVSTTPSRLEVFQGNQSNASLYVTVHNAAENTLKHQATLIPNAWVASGTCVEAAIPYDFECDVVVKAAKTAAVGAASVNVTLRTTDKKSYDIADVMTLYVLAEEARADVQSVSPETLYCEGQQQQNPASVKITAVAKNLASFTLLDEAISFNGQPITRTGTGRLCSQQASGQSITCTIPTDKLLEKVKCGSGELVPGGGSHYYPLTLAFLVKAGSEQMTLSGSHDVAVVARPLEPYLDIVDNDVVGGSLQTPLNCLGSQTIKLGDSGYVRIMYADLLHAEPKEDDLKWTFRLDAQDDKGKLTKGMGVSPEANATVCKFINYQSVGTHRIEDYECSFYVDSSMFQRCENGEGEIKLTVTSNTGKKAEGVIDASVIKDSSLYQIAIEVVTAPQSQIDCQIQSYGGNAPCSLASESNQNVTLRIYNRNAQAPLTDLNVYDFDVRLTGRTVDANERALGTCRKDSKDSNKYFCPFQIGPVIKLPTETHNVTKEKDEYAPISLGSLNVTVYMKYANNLVTDTRSVLDGSITITPKKTNSMLDAEAMMEKMQRNFKDFEKYFKTIVLVLSACAVCSFGNQIISAIESTSTKLKTSQPQAGTGTANQQLYDACYQSQLANCLDLVKNGQAAAANVTDSSECSEKAKSICSKIYPVASTGKPEETKDTTFSAWDAVSILVSGIITVYAITKLSKFSLGDEEEKKSEITKSLEKGIKWGLLACVMPRLVGDIGGWIASKGSATENVFGKISSVGEGMGNACNVVLRLMPVVMGFIQFYMSYLQFQMCMEMLQVSLEASAYTASGISNEAYQAQASTQAAMSMTTQMMSCFNTLMNALNQLTYSMMYTTQALGGLFSEGTYAVIFKYSGREIPANSQISGTGILEVYVKNICRGGSSQAKIDIFGKDAAGKSCARSDSTPCLQTSYIPYTSSAGYPYNYYQQQTSSLTSRIDTNTCETGDINVIITMGSGRTDSYIFKYDKTGTSQTTTKKANGADCLGPTDYSTECDSGYCCCTAASPQKTVCAAYSSCQTCTS